MEFHRLFVEQMTVHHRGAVGMAETVRDDRTVQIAEMAPLQDLGS